MKILVPRFDTYGDIILASGLLEGLLSKWPESEIHLLVRQRYADIRHLLPASLRWHGTAMEPRCVLPRKIRADDDIAGLISECWDMMLGTTYDRSWLDDEIASDLSRKGVRCVRIAEAGTDRTEAGVESVFVPRATRESEKYNELFREITNSSTGLPPPRLSVPCAEKQQAAVCLEDRGLSPGAFLACVPGGNMNNPLKVWDPSNFAKCIARIEAEYGLPALLIGHDSESQIIDTARRLAESMGAAPRVWTGCDGQIALAGALLETARLYVGNDTGTLHLAQALGTPSVAVFGGGHWPRFVPTGPGIAVHSSWDCYGCDWHCLYGHAYCIETVDEEDVFAAAVQILTSPPASHQVIDSRRKNFPTAADLKAATQNFVTISKRAATLPWTKWELQGVIQREQGVITQLRDTSERAVALEGTLAERAVEMQASRERIAQLQAQIAALDERVRAADVARDSVNLELEILRLRLAESNDREASSSVKTGSELAASPSAEREAREALEREIGETRAAMRRAAADADAESTRLKAEADRLAKVIEGVRQNPFEWLVTSRSAASNPIEFLEPSVPGLISVIIPAYNAVASLERAVKSVWAQNPGDFKLEVLVCDDGSKDATADLARHLAQQSIVPTRVLQHPGNGNQGVSATRNAGIRHARGEFISLLDADDRWLPQKTALQIEYFRQHPEVACLCSLGWNRNITGDSVKGWNGTNIAGDYSGAPAPADFSPPYTFHQLLKSDPIVNSTVMMRREAVGISGGYTEVMAHQAEDWLLFLKIALISPIHLIQEPLIDYIIHPDSYTTQYFTDGLAYGARVECMFQLLHWMLQKPEYREMAKWVYRRQLPQLLAAHRSGYKLIESYYQSKNGKEGDLLSYEAHLCHVYNRLERLDFLEHYYEHIEAQINLARRVPGMTKAYHLARTVWRRLNR
jgi:ADP-heptose:LPS heptosyltransferase/glycosyltransferase involved in cell wall biosynthesis